MILLIKNLKDVIRKLLELISKFSKVADTRLIHRNLFHFYTLAMKYHQKIKQTILFTITSKRMINLAINLPKEAKDYKILMKEIKDDTKRW